MASICSLSSWCVCFSAALSGPILTEDQPRNLSARGQNVHIQRRASEVFPCLPPFRGHPAFQHEFPPLPDLSGKGG